MAFSRLSDYNCAPELIKDYPLKKNGTGIVFVVANFTHELEGYKVDIDRIQNFFENDLRYEVVTEVSDKDLENLTYEELSTKLVQMRKRVEAKPDKYDRFYLFIMSHGSEDGILCMDKDEKERYKTISVNGIVDPFRHNKMKSMKGFPKIFFIQACRGDDYIAVADKPHKLGKWPIEADIMICQSVTDHHKSFVRPGTGSLFIKKTIGCMGLYAASKEDIGVIMREVKYEVADTRDMSDGIIEVRQMSTVMDNLTMRLPIARGTVTKKKKGQKQVHIGKQVMKQGTTTRIFDGRFSAHADLFDIE